MVLCSQGKVIPGLVAGLATASGLAPPKPPARKGSFWALSLVDGRLVAADYYRDVTGTAGRPGLVP